ncbi:hypothetical protein ACJROX_10155 [Pseudalkalibacillus sp. A8]|uniref:hypothetical protein n=1 Tax=Pseudalkalibacillus sp. A8 TaxID=3382641 RepID=UPI0038B58F2A
MINVRIWLHIALLGSFALPWLKIPIIVTVVPVAGYSIPYKTNALANQLSSLGVITINNEQMYSLYLMLLAPVISVFVLVRLLSKYNANIYLDCTAGVIAVLSCLYILSNSGTIVTFGFYMTLIVSLLLVASPLFHRKKENTIRVHNRAVLK